MKEQSFEFKIINQIVKLKSIRKYGICSEKGVYVMQLSKQKLEHFATYLEGIYTFSMIEMTDGNIAASTKDKGIQILKYGTKTIKIPYAQGGVIQKIPGADSTAYFLSRDYKGFSIVDIIGKSVRYIQ